MSKISTLSTLPDSIATQAVNNSAATRALKAQSGSAASADEATTSYQAQLTKLSSILSGLQLGATHIRAQYLQAANQVKSGTYQVDPLQISRSIVTDLLGPSTKN